MLAAVCLVLAHGGAVHARVPAGAFVRAPQTRAAVRSNADGRGSGHGIDEPSAKAKEAIGTIEVLVSSVLSTVRTNTDTWLNSGWSVKKRAGQWLPEVRPNSEDIAMRLAPADAPARATAGGEGEVLDAIDVEITVPTAANGASAAPADLQAARRSGLAEVTSANLQTDFIAFLAEREAGGGGAVSVGWNGAVTFKSRAELARVVADFSYEKLRQISAAARALARYVDDLEAELETADVQVVQLRAQMRESARLAAERDAALADVQRRASEVESQLGATVAELEAGERALVEAEQRAEDAASELLELQRRLREAEARGESVAEQRREAESLGVKFETQLLDAERRALAGERTKRKLAAELDQLARARADADLRAQSANQLAQVRDARARRTSSALARLTHRAPAAPRPARRRWSSARSPPRRWLSARPTSSSSCSRRGSATTRSCSRRSARSNAGSRRSRKPPPRSRRATTRARRAFSTLRARRAGYVPSCAT